MPNIVLGLGVRAVLYVPERARYDLQMLSAANRDLTLLGPFTAQERCYVSGAMNHAKNLDAVGQSPVKHDHPFEA